MLGEGPRKGGEGGMEGGREDCYTYFNGPAIFK